MSRFKFSAWDNFQDQPVVHPGKIFDRADNDGISAVPEGGPAPYGRVLVAGRSSHPSNSSPSAADPALLGQPGEAFDPKARYMTMNATCSLPDYDGEWLKHSDGTLYQAAATGGGGLPTDVDTKLIVLGVGMWTEHNACFNKPLEQPFGLGDIYYQDEGQGQIGIAQEGRIWCYCETDINKGDRLYFRRKITSTTDGVQLLGAFTTVNDSLETQYFPYGTVYRPGAAGGAFVLNLNQQAFGTGGI